MSLVLEDLSALRAPLDIPIPDPAKEELKRKKKEEVVMLNFKTFKHLNTFFFPTGFRC